MSSSKSLLLALCAALCAPAWAKPIAYRDSTTVMGEWDPSTWELQVFYAPSVRYSLGPSWHGIESEAGHVEHFGYLRGNLLAQRWNRRRAQGNAFLWAGLGVHARATHSERVAYNLGAQLDYETLRVFSMARVDWHASTRTQHGVTTLQLGWTPYAHSIDGLAAWGVLQAKHAFGDLREGTETAALIRLFRRQIWIEFGVNDRGRPLAMFMWVR